MAQVADVEHLRALADEYIGYLEAEWNAVPALVAEWPNWDDISRLSFAADWPIREDRLGQLREMHSLKLLSFEQQARLIALEQLVAEQRPVVERLLED